MGKAGGLALRGTQSLLYFLAFCCAAIVLGFYSYFLSVLADRHSSIPKWEKAVEGISGAAVLYTIAATVLTCCIGGITFFALLGMVLDVLFAAAFIALAVLTRDGAHSCKGDNISTPLGSGNSDTGANGFNNSDLTYQVKNGTACRFNKACFIVSIIGAFLFLFAAVFQLFLSKHHKKEKRYGPSPTNGYTSGSAGRRRFWQRKPKNHVVPTTTGTTHAQHNGFTKDAEAGAVGAGLAAHHHNNNHSHVDTRPSHETGYTGSTVGGTGAYTGNKYDTTAHPAGEPLAAPTATHDVRGSHGYHTAPTGTAVNPYGYEHGRNAATNY